MKAGKSAAFQPSFSIVWKRSPEGGEKWLLAGTSPTKTSTTL
jgi:hypothetical protein